MPLVQSWPWHVQGQRYTWCILHASLTPKLHSISLYDESFPKYRPFWDKCTEWPQNDLDMLKVKNINMHAAYIPEAQTFVSFALPWAIFELQSNFGKNSPNDPKMTWHIQCQNTNMHTTYTPRGLTFHPFCSTMSRFQVRPKFEKNGPNDHHACYIHPWGPNFLPFHSMMSIFWVTPFFRKSVPNDPKWPWHVQGPKYQHACYIHPWGPYFCPFWSTINCFCVIAQVPKEAHTEWSQLLMILAELKIVRAYDPGQATTKIWKKISNMGLEIIVTQMRDGWKDDGW